MQKQNFYTGENEFVSPKEEMLMIQDQDLRQAIEFAKFGEDYYKQKNQNINQFNNNTVEYVKHKPLEKINISRDGYMPAYTYIEKDSDEDIEESSEPYVVPGFIFEDGNQDKKEKFDPVNSGNMMFPGYLYEKREYKKATYDYNSTDDSSSTSAKSSNNPYMNMPQNQTSVQTGVGYGLGSNPGYYNTENGVVFTGNPALMAGYKPNNNANTNVNPINNLVGLSTSKRKIVKCNPGTNTVNVNLSKNISISKPKEEEMDMYIPPYNPLGIEEIFPVGLENTIAEIANNYDAKSREFYDIQVANMNRMRRNGSFNIYNANPQQNYYGQQQMNMQKFVYYTGINQVQHIISDAKEKGLDLSMNLSKLAHKYIKDGITDEQINDIYNGYHKNVKGTIYEITDFDILEDKFKRLVPSEYSGQAEDYREAYNKQRNKIAKILPPNTKAEDFGMFASELVSKWDREEEIMRHRRLNNYCDTKAYSKALSEKVINDLKDPNEIVSPLFVRRCMDYGNSDIKVFEVKNQLIAAFDKTQFNNPMEYAYFRDPNVRLENKKRGFQNYIKNLVVDRLPQEYRRYAELLFYFDIDNLGNLIPPSDEFIRDYIFGKSNDVSININENEYAANKAKFNMISQNPQFIKFMDFIDGFPNLDNPRNKAARDDAIKDYINDMLTDPTYGKDEKIIRELAIKKGKEQYPDLFANDFNSNKE